MKQMVKAAAAAAAADTKTQRSFTAANPHVRLLARD
jgi:hypothetical protein